MGKKDPTGERNARNPCSHHRSLRNQWKKEGNPYNGTKTEGAPEKVGGPDQWNRASCLQEGKYLTEVLKQGEGQ